MIPCFSDSWCVDQIACAMYGKDHCESYDWINLNCPKLCGHCGTGKYHNDVTWFSDTYLVNLTAHLMPCFTNLASDTLNLSSVKSESVLALNIHCMESSWHSHTKRFFLRHLILMDFFRLGGWLPHLRMMLLRILPFKFPNICVFRISNF